MISPRRSARGARHCSGTRGTRPYDRDRSRPKLCVSSNARKHNMGRTLTLRSSVGIHKTRSSSALVPCLGVAISVTKSKRHFRSLMRDSDAQNIAPWGTTPHRHANLETAVPQVREGVG